MDLSIVIVTYKSRGLLRQCLLGLRALPAARRHEIIVIDNNSQDGTRELLMNEFPEVRSIMQVSNLGFGAGGNVGIRASSGRYVAVMNPDIVVVDDSFDRLISYLDQHTKVGLVGPQLMNPDGSLQRSCYRFHTPLIPVYRRTPLGNFTFARERVSRFLMEEWDHASEREVDWLLGACLVARRALLNEIGCFDERFFLYFEDTDLCRRAWQAGWRVVYQPSARFFHYHRRASAESPLLPSLFNPVTRLHISSWIKYLWKYRGQPLPYVPPPQFS
ncbi:glycosyltransferase family 2 protein [Candidatus Uhrbacteria bacterium]|nr:glycosyltransferase family 2 protein [Candidatus Uhrbacteria bacterium]